MSSTAHLSQGGVDLYLESIDGALVIRHWGASCELDGFPFGRSIPHSDFDEIQNPGVMREQSRGWLHYPTLSGHRNGQDWSTKFELKDLESSDNFFRATLIDDRAKLEIQWSGSLDKNGVLKLKALLTNHGDPYILNGFQYWLPLNDCAQEILDFTGRWGNERNPQRTPIAIGRHVREVMEGRSGHNNTIGMIALTPETNFRHGQAWAVALAWSGNSSYSVEKSFEGVQSLGAGEYLLPGEIILEKGQSYQAPELFALYSENGLDGLSASIHQHLRDRQNHPKKARPLTLNMWEAIYFNHDEEKIRALVDIAAEIGVERVVLDDGWFGSRKSDRQGLGDWREKSPFWPKGLSPISQYIRAKGMEFGLWFEGEMLNRDSQLYRHHPDWVLGNSDSPTWRHQVVLNLSHPEAFQYILETLLSVIQENHISYIKWDHNRSVTEASYLGSAAVHRQSQAIYRLFAELKATFPELEIESCASGGGRIDLGIIDYVDRFWVSDNNDALERQKIQRWTMQFIPPELLGTHVGPTPGHQSGRELSLAMRMATAFFGHAGIEWDISAISMQEREELKEWIGRYKESRGLLHNSTMVRVDYPDEHHYLYGVVSQDAKSAIFNFVQLEPSITSHPPNLRFSGLDPLLKYRITLLAQGDFMAISQPEWMNGEYLVTGSALMESGLPAPILRPANALTIQLQAG
jgi:alpha-galactosidase